MSALKGPGFSYLGDVLNGKRHGRGRCDYTDGSAYDGSWVEDQRHGSGALILHGLRSDEVEWHHDQTTSLLRFTDPATSTSFSLSYSNDSIHGLVNVSLPNGSVISGQFDHGSPVGSALIESGSGNHIQAPWASLDKTNNLPVLTEKTLLALGAPGRHRIIVY